MTTNTDRVALALSSLISYTFSEPNVAAAMAVGTHASQLREMEASAREVLKLHDRARMSAGGVSDDALGDRLALALSGMSARTFGDERVVAALRLVAPTAVINSLEGDVRGALAVHDGVRMSSAPTAEPVAAAPAAAPSRVATLLSFLRPKAERPQAAPVAIPEEELDQVQGMRP